MRMHTRKCNIAAAQGGGGGAHRAIGPLWDNRENRKIIKNIKEFVFVCYFALYGTWEALDSFKRLSWSMRSFSDIGIFIPRTCF